MKLNNTPNKKTDRSHHWPEELQPVFNHFMTTEYASLTKKGEPLTYPLTPYVGDKTLDVSTGLTYPTKAERARRNPKVCLLYSYPIGSGLQNPPTVLVYGMAAVRDKDIQTNTDRYTALSIEKNKDAMTLPGFVMRRMNWYFARIWIEVTPIRILWWTNTEEAPNRWDAPADIDIPASDPAPQPAPYSRWKEAPGDWHPRAEYALENLGAPVLTLVDEEGFPVPFRVKTISSHANGFSLELPVGVPVPAHGHACLTFHKHPEKFTGQENMVFLGNIADNTTFVVDRCPGDWSLPATGYAAAALAMLKNGRSLAPRLKQEAQRRNQPVPVVNLPAQYRRKTRGESNP